jgi:prepilin-type N-terminal cleavage/methylation domain-containing protein
MTSEIFLSIRDNYTIGLQSVLLPHYNGPMKQSASGFTIIELLIVVVVIAILAAISVAAYSGLGIRAQASAMASDLKAAEKAFNAFRITSGAGDWWIDTEATLTGSTAGNPRIDTIITAQPELQKYLAAPPTRDGFITPNHWFYDNDGDTYNGCSASTAGVSFVIFNPQNTELVQAIDDAIDDGNLSCGKVRMAGSNFMYGLS